MMKHATASTLTLLCLLAIAVAAQEQKPPPPPAEPGQGTTITRRVDVVNMVFSVLNRRQKFITDLTRENFEVYENNEVQKITFFGRQTDLPLRVGILLDTSNSIRPRLEFEQGAAVDFVHNVVRRKKDLAFLMTFDSEAGLIEDYTDDVSRLTDAVMRQRAGGGTALYGAIRFACRERLANPPLPKDETLQVRRVLVVISDGIDADPGGPSRSEAMEACQRAQASIYTISTSTDWIAVSNTKPQKYHLTEGDKVLRQFAEETGGRAFFPYRLEDLAQSFLDIDQELRSQYQLAYEPTNRRADGRFREIRIEVDRKGLQVRSRKGYFADSTRPAASPPAT